MAIINTTTSSLAWADKAKKREIAKAKKAKKKEMDKARRNNIVLKIEGGGVISLREYLFIRKPMNALTFAECDTLCIPRGCESGWLKRHGKMEITKELYELLVVASGKKRPRFTEHCSISLGASSGPSATPQSKYESSRIDFYASREWRELRYKALVKNGSACQCCGATRSDGVKLHVDHIKPRSKFPELELDLSNLQVLCEDCNLGKSNKDQTDWRENRQ